MPQNELKGLILSQLMDHEPHAIPELVDQTLKANVTLYESDIKSALLGLIRRNQLDLTDDFKVRLPQHSLAVPRHDFALV